MFIYVATQLKDLEKLSLNPFFPILISSVDILITSMLKTTFTPNMLPKDVQGKVREPADLSGTDF